MAAIVNQQKNSAPPTATTKFTPQTIISSVEGTRGALPVLKCVFCEPSLYPIFQPREPLRSGWCGHSAHSHAARFMEDEMV